MATSQALTDVERAAIQILVARDLDSYVRQENEMSITGATFIAQELKSQIEQAKAKLQKAHASLGNASDNLSQAGDKVQGLADQINNEANDLHSMVGQYSNGAPAEPTKA